MKTGQIVFSKNGRDKGRAFVVLSVSGEYVYLTDGLMRPLTKPKKKKRKHIQPTNEVWERAAEGCEGILDADIRRRLMPYNKKPENQANENGSGNG